MSRILGAIRQNGYVVRDIHAAIKYWVEVVGVGPWFLGDPVAIEDFRYRGQPSPAKVAIALANSGDLQLELIQQVADGPSLYRDFLETHGEGLQHIAYWTREIEGDCQRLLKLGWRIGQTGHVGNPGRFIYFETTGHAGTCVEISDISGPKGPLFQRIREAAANWDGKEPVRPFWAAR
ncbi:MAG: VOC family protein [Alphaproteobacteria bacterium]|nr:VOC family protein [Alphaproteobacteria bacterium]